MDLINCYSCAMVCEGARLSEHVSTDAHQMKVVQFFKNPFPPPMVKRCEFCCINVPTMAWDAHLASKEHNVWATHQKYLKFHCHLCNVSGNIDEWFSHVSTKKHKRSKGRFCNRPEPKFPMRRCYVCCTDHPNEVWESHRDGKVHKDWSRKEPPAEASKKRRRFGEEEDDDGGGGSEVVDQRALKKLNCNLCKRHYKLDKWASHLADRLHKQKVDAFLQLPAPHPVFRRCFVCCTDALVNNWSIGHCLSKRHLAHVMHSPALPGSTLYCRTCLIDVSRTEWDRHLRSYNHLKRTVTSPVYVHCDACRIDIPYSDWDSHESQKHRKMSVKQKRNIGTAMCEICNKTLMGIRSYRNHVRTEGHKECKKQYLGHGSEDNDRNVTITSNPSSIVPEKKKQRGGDVEMTVFDLTEVTKNDEDDDSYKRDGWDKELTVIIPENKQSEDIKMKTNKKEDVKPGLIMKCEACNIECSASEWNTHIGSKSHEMKVRPRVYCVTCKTEIAVSEWEEHEKRHGTSTPEHWVQCVVCNETCYSMQAWVSHMIGVGHMEKMQKFRLLPKLETEKKEEKEEKKEVAMVNLVDTDADDSKDTAMTDVEVISVKCVSTKGSYQHCKLCDEQVRTGAWMEHIISRKHTINASHTSPWVAAPRTLRCALCEIECASSQWNNHITSVQHRAHKATSPLLVYCCGCENYCRLTDWRRHMRRHGNQVPRVWITCNICNGPPLSSLEQFNRHLVSYAHKRNLNEYSSGAGVRTVYCESCSTDFLPEHLDLHRQFEFCATSEKATSSYGERM